jgi:hypothetical protein
MATSELILVLRLFHIVGGAFWFGAVVTAVFFIEPTAEALGAEGERFFAHLAITRRLAAVTAIAATTAIVAGAGLFWIDSSGLQLGWIETHTGLAFALGGLAGFVAFLIAGFFLKPYYDAFVRWTAAATTVGEAELGRQRDELQRLEHRARQWSLVQVALLLFAVAAMATARYIP